MSPLLSNYKVHLAFGFTIRIVFLLYGVWHDSVSSVPYTDVDYKVFTDAARHITLGNSPYDRHTYRYTPLIAAFMLPNIWLHPAFGKVLFCCVDIAVAMLIRILVRHACMEYVIREGGDGLVGEDGAAEAVGRKRRNKTGHRKLSVQGNKLDNVLPINDLSLQAMLVWLYCPLTIAIATRGNADSIAALLILASLHQLQVRHSYFFAGLLHGISVHTRLYPIAYSLAMFMSLSAFSWYGSGRESSGGKLSREDREVILNSSDVRKDGNKNKSIQLDPSKPKQTVFQYKYLLYLWPNQKQLKLIVGCFMSLTLLTSICYYLYGYKFLYETYLFHLTRKDTRHNFSLYFYLQYLTAGVKNIGVWQSILTLLPQIVLLIVFSIRYGLNRFSLSFSLLAQTIVMIAYNTVLTSQYFVWILAVLPLCLWQINIRVGAGVFMIGAWFVAQGAWLLPAYYLEFQGKNTFWYIWVQSVSFFCVNIWVLGRLMLNFSPPLLKGKMA